MSALTCLYITISHPIGYPIGRSSFIYERCFLVTLLSFPHVRRTITISHFIHRIAVEFASEISDGVDGFARNSWRAATHCLLKVSKSQNSVVILLFCFTRFDLADKRGYTLACHRGLGYPIKGLSILFATLDQRWTPGQN